MRKLAVALLAAGALACVASCSGSSSPSHASSMSADGLVQIIDSAPHIQTFTVAVDGARSEVAEYQISVGYRDHVTRDAAYGPHEELSLGQTLYVRTAGHKWVKIERPKDAFPNVLPRPPGEAFLPLIREAQVTDLGRETLDGATVTHYRAVEDLQALGTGSGTSSTELYLDARNLPVRAVTVIKSAAGTSLTTTRKYSGYGKAVKGLTAPSRQQVARTITVHNSDDLTAALDAAFNA